MPEVQPALAEGAGARAGSVPATVAKIAVSAALVGFILYRVELGEVALALRGARLQPLLFAFCLNFVGYFLSVSRWRILLAAHGVRPRLLTLTQSHMVAIFFNNLLPSTIGGDAIRAYDSWRLGTSRVAAVATIVMDRLTGLLALLLCASAALLVSGPLLDAGPRWWLVAALLLMSAAAAGFGVTARHAHRISAIPLPARLAERLGAVTEKISLAFRAFSTRRATLLAAFGLSILLQINVIVFYALIGAAFDLTLPLIAYFLIVPPALAVMLIPISINAVGIRENIFAYLLGIYGVAVPEAIAFAWAAFGLILIHGLLGGIVYALRR